MCFSLYEGKLSPTLRWPEANPNFAEVKDILLGILTDLKEGDGKVSVHKGKEIWVHGADCWLRIDTEQGVIEIGEGAA